MRSGSGIVAAGAVAAVLLAGGVGLRADERDDARAAGEQWLRLIDDGRYEEAWDASSELARHGTVRSIWVDSWRKGASERGALVSRELKTSVFLPQHEYADTKVDAVLMTYTTTYQKTAAAMEQMAVVRDTDGAWRVYLFLLLRGVPAR